MQVASAGWRETAASSPSRFRHGGGMLGTTAPRRVLSSAPSVRRQTLNSLARVDCLARGTDTHSELTPPSRRPRLLLPPSLPSPHTARSPSARSFDFRPRRPSPSLLRPRPPTVRSTSRSTSSAFPLPSFPRLRLVQLLWLYALLVTRFITMLRVATLLSAAALLSADAVRAAAVSHSAFPNSACAGASSGALGGLVGIGKVTLSNGDVEAHCGCVSVRPEHVALPLRRSASDASSPLFVERR